MDNGLNMIKTSNMFKNVATDIYNNYSKNENYGYYIPLLVNSAFSTEVALKFILKFDRGNYKSIHELHKHWNQLNNHYKSCICFYFNEVCQTTYNSTDIENKVKEFSKTFEDLRYSFERNQTYVEPKFIMELMYAVSFVANCLYDSKTKDSEMFMLNCIEKIRGEKKIEIQF